MLGDPPLRDPVISDDGQALGTWGKWFLKLRKAVDGATATSGLTARAGQTATISSTPVQTATLPAGLYLVSYYARITRAATVSSSLTVAINWTDGAVACTQAGAALTGNTTDTVQTNTLLVRIDAGTTIRYQATYATSGATTMAYRLDVSVQALVAPL